MAHTPTIRDPEDPDGHSWLRAVPPRGEQVTTTISILLADAHDFLRRSLRALLDSDGELEVVGEAHNVAAAVRQAQTQEPNVLILDIGMPSGAILGVIRELHARAPHTAVVVTTMLDDVRFADYQPLAGAWVAARVEVHSEDKLVFSEDYTDIQANVKLAPAVYDPQQFSTTHWEK